MPKDISVEWKSRNQDVNLSHLTTEFMMKAWSNSDKTNKYRWRVWKYIFILIKWLIYLVYVCVSICLSFPSHVHVVASCGQRTTIKESSLSFHTVSSEDQVQATKLRSKHLYPLGRSFTCLTIPRRYKIKFITEIERTNWNTESFSVLMWTFRYNSEIPMKT